MDFGGDQEEKDYQGNPANPSIWLTHELPMLRELYKFGTINSFQTISPSGGAGYDLTIALYYSEYPRKIPLVQLPPRDAPMDEAFPPHKPWVMNLTATEPQVIHPDMEITNFTRQVWEMLRFTEQLKVSKYFILSLFHVQSTAYLSLRPSTQLSRRRWKTSWKRGSVWQDEQTLVQEPVVTRSQDMITSGDGMASGWLQVVVKQKNSFWSSLASKDSISMCPRWMYNKVAELITSKNSQQCQINTTSPCPKSGNCSVSLQRHGPKTIVSHTYNLKLRWSKISFLNMKHGKKLQWRIKLSRYIVTNCESAWTLS